MPQELLTTESEFFGEGVNVDAKKPKSPPPEFCEYPGPRIMAMAGFGHWDESDPDGERSSFVLVRNPLERDAVIPIFLGPEKERQSELRRHLPGEHPHQPFTKFRVRIPAGASAWIPKIWRPAIRRDDPESGRAVAGLFPQAMFGTERQGTVEVHPALQTPEQSDPPPPRAPRRRQP